MKKPHPYFNIRNTLITLFVIGGLIIGYLRLTSGVVEDRPSLLDTVHESHARIFDANPNATSQSLGFLDITRCSSTINHAIIVEHLAGQPHLQSIDFSDKSSFIPVQSMQACSTDLQCRYQVVREAMRTKARMCNEQPFRLPGNPCPLSVPYEKSVLAEAYRLPKPDYLDSLRQQILTGDNKSDKMLEDALICLTSLESEVGISNSLKRDIR
ncbi:hypothetical protein [Hyphomonas oceanitis]|uniref:hypothetical protein n=1 Tax=Hyphomonas oceanitis TaxID=81033 RepID=UPI003000FE05